jgi:hypothetical protein
MTRRVALSGCAAALLLLVASAAARADVVEDWNTIMLNTIATQNPFAQARFAAITQLAVFEAVNACTHHYEPYLGTVTAASGASPEAAAIAAAHAVLRNYFPAAGATLDAARDSSLLAIPDGASKTAGVTAGVAAAQAMIAARANDGSSPPQTFLPSSSDPGVWQPTPPAFGPGLFLHWRDVTPFGIDRSDQFRLDPPPALDSQRYRKAYDEVKTVGEIGSTMRPQDRTDVALFYAALSPAQVWNITAQQVIDERETSISRKARAFALMNMAISDALVSVFDTKYFYVFWRPVTAIRAGDADGNPKTEGDAAWTPLIATPSFPSYASAHGAGSGAAAKVLTFLFGAGGHRIALSTPAVQGVTLHYTTFQEMTDDVSDARVYGGIHFRFDQDGGDKLGRQVGRYIVDHKLRRAHRD